MRGSPDGLFPRITSTLFQLRNYILGHTLTLQAELKQSYFVHLVDMSNGVPQTSDPL
jgi:hypothetical protein